MDTPDRGIGDDFVKGKGGLWTRREMVTAVGTGMGTLAAPWVRRRDTLKIRFHGVMLVRKVGLVEVGANEKSHVVDVLMPFARDSKTGYHPDSTPAVPHAPHLAVFKQHQRDNYVDSFKIADKSLIISGATSNRPAQLDFLLSLRNILLPTATPRPETGVGAARYGSRVRLIGGSFAPVSGSVEAMGKWRVARSFNANAPTEMDPVVTGVEWDSLKDDVKVLDSSGNVVCPLPYNGGSAIVIGHLPAAHDPKHWYDGDFQAPVVGTADHDFKWLYTLFAPRTLYSDLDPWGKELGFDILLPAPRCFKAPTHTQHPTMPGSSTCFGGEG